MDDDLLRTFVAAVRTMRKAQKAYFATRSHGELVAAKKAERHVDRLLAKMPPVEK